MQRSRVTSTKVALVGTVVLAFLVFVIVHNNDDVVVFAVVVLVGIRITVFAFESILFVFVSVRVVAVHVVFLNIHRISLQRVTLGTIHELLLGERRAAALHSPRAHRG